LIARHCLGDLALACEHVSQIAVGLGEVRLEDDRPLVTLRGVRELALVAEHMAQIAMNLGTVRP
jgi:hypothetical protein